MSVWHEFIFNFDRRRNRTFVYVDSCNKFRHEGWWSDDAANFSQFLSKMFSSKLKLNWQPRALSYAAGVSADKSLESSKQQQEIQGS